MGGTVITSDKNFLYVDMGLKDYCLLPREEATYYEESTGDSLSVGDVREFMVVQDFRKARRPFISIKALVMDEAWDFARRQARENTILEVPISEITRGGYRVDLGYIKSFLPSSQIHPTY